jgi:hypothetical protein
MLHSRFATTTRCTTTAAAKLALHARSERVAPEFHPPSGTRSAGVVLLSRVPEGALKRGWPQEAMQGSSGRHGVELTHTGCAHQHQETRSAATKSRPTPAAAAASVSEGGACIICLESDPPPIQSGCACRGDAGLAHVECRAEDAAHRMASSNTTKGWWVCGTCGQGFTGFMLLGLAELWWSKAQRLPKENEQRIIAAQNLADALHGQGRHSEAEALYRKTRAVRPRVLGPEHPRTLCSCARQGTWPVQSINKEGTLKPRQCTASQWRLNEGCWDPNTRTR